MTIATAVIPVSPKHRQTGIYQQALQSVKNQTIPTDCIIEYDDNGTGAGATRNRATAKVSTPFVIWIDADDILRPSFVEDCLRVYQQGSYVYTDWIINGMVMNTPNCLHMFEEGQEHVITTLLPVTAWQSAGGFDETLNTLEDEDFYRKLHAYGWCGVRCPEPLIEYRRHLGQSLVNKDVVDLGIQQQRVAEKHALFTNRYRRFQQIMSCGCEDISKTTQNAVGERQPNDVLAERLGSPMRIEGAVTKRLYPRAGLNQPIWADEDDARARPDLFRIIASNPDKVSPDVETVKRLTVEAIEREFVVEGEQRFVEAQMQREKIVQAAREKVKGQEVALRQSIEDVKRVSDMTRTELLALAQERGIEVIGTGTNGYIKKADVLDALA